MAVYLTDRASLSAHLEVLLNDTTDTFFTDDVKSMAINLAYARLYNKASELRDGQGPVIKSTTLTEVAGADEIALPSDVSRVVDVRYVISDDNWVPWFPDNPAQRSRYNSSYGGGRYSRFWSIRPKLAAGVVTLYLLIAPIPNVGSTGKVTIDYIPEFTPLTNALDLPVFPSQHRELIVYEAYARLLEKEKQDMNKLSYSIWQDLKVQFESDMETWNVHSERIIQGDGDYDIYEDDGYFGV